MTWLPAFNTSLILVSGFFLALGYAFIRARRIRAHHRSMLTATIFAGLFLVVYVARAIFIGPKEFDGPPLAYAVYLAILVPHVVAAIAVGPLALLAIARALRSNFVGHRRIARVTLPIWAYVAASGWAVYVMLYVIAWDR